MEIEVRNELTSVDRERVLALVDLAEAATGHPALSDSMLVALRAPAAPVPAAPVPAAPVPAGASDLVPGASRLAACLLATSSELGDQGELLGCAPLAGGPRTWSLELVVLPGRSSEADSELAEALIVEALARAAASGGGLVHLVAPKPTSGLDAAVVSTGFWLDRRLLQMRRGLPFDPPDDQATISTRAFVVGRDEAGWLRVNNRAFAGHPEQGNWDLATVQAWERLDWFDPEGFLLHEIDGRLAAFCWTKVHQAAPSDPDTLAGSDGGGSDGAGSAETGEIYVIAVDPELQGRGLGRALAVAGAAHLARRGISAISLYVDAASTPAVALYRSLGFTVDHEDRAYVTTIDRS